MEKIDTALFEYFLDIQRIASKHVAQDLASSSGEDARRVITDVRLSAPLEYAWSSVMFINEDGEIAYNTDQNSTLSTIEEDPLLFSAYHSAWNGSVSVTDVELQDSSVDPVVLFAAPIEGAGVVLGHANWRTVANILENVPERAYLYNRRGELVATTHSSERDSSAAFSFSNQGRGGSYVRGEGESASQIAYTTQVGIGSFRGNNWLLALEKPIDEQTVLGQFQEGLSVLAADLRSIAAQGRAYAKRL